MLALVGLICLWAALLFLLRNSNALSALKFGLSLVPLVLFVNLILLVIRVIINILGGNTGYLLERMVSRPEKVLLVPILVLVLAVLSVLSKTDRKNA
jgi:hypothetical protein